MKIPAAMTHFLVGLAFFIAAIPWGKASEVPAGWKIKREQSRMDDSVGATLSLSAKAPILVHGRHYYPELVIRCWEGTTAFYVAWGDYMGLGNTAVSFRVDQLPAESRTWVIDETRNATGLWENHLSVPFVRRLFNHKTLLVRASPVAEPPVMAEFDISEIQAATVPLANTCGWSNTPATSSDSGALHAAIAQQWLGNAMNTDVQVRLVIQIDENGWINNVKGEAISGADSHDAWLLVGSAERAAVQAGRVTVPAGRYEIVLP